MCSTDEMELIAKPEEDKKFFSLPLSENVFFARRLLLNERPERHKPPQKNVS